MHNFLGDQGIRAGARVRMRENKPRGLIFKPACEETRRRVGDGAWSCGETSPGADFRVVLRGNKATCGGWGWSSGIVGLAYPVLEFSLPSLVRSTHVKGTGLSKSPWYPLYIRFA